MADEKSVEKVQLTVSQVLNDLANGLDRKAIRSKYGLNAQGIKQLFAHPKLKGMKVKPAPNFVLTDDTPDKPAKKAAEAEAITDTAAEKGVW